VLAAGHQGCQGQGQALGDMLLMQEHRAQRWAGARAGGRGKDGGRGWDRGRKKALEELEEIDSETSGSSDEEIEEGIEPLQLHEQINADAKS